MRQCPVYEPCSPRRDGLPERPRPRAVRSRVSASRSGLPVAAEPAILTPERARTARATPPQRPGACHAPCKRGMPVDEGDNNKAPWKVGGVCCCRLATRASGPGKKSGRPGDVQGVEGRELVGLLGRLPLPGAVGRWGGCRCSSAAVDRRPQTRKGRVSFDAAIDAQGANPMPGGGFAAGASRLQNLRCRRVQS